MKSNLYIIIYLLSNIFRTFDVYLFYETFLTDDQKRKEKKYCYIAYYLVISVEYIWLDIPILTLLLNVVGLLLLTLLYDSSMKKRFLGAGFILALLMVTEALVVSLTGYLSFSLFQKGFFSSLGGVVCIPIVSFLFIMLYRKLKKNKFDIAVPLSYWIMVIVVPVACIYLIAIGFSIEKIQTWQLLSLVIILFLIMLSVFLLYEKQIEFFVKENRKNMLEVQNQYYHKQLDTMLEMENATRSLRHDMKNHLLTIDALTEQGAVDKIRDYVKDLQKFSRPVQRYFSTGNIVIDSILNSKTYEAQGKGIEMDVKVVIPENLPLDDMDCTILLGNLLDNAIENAKDWIRFVFRYDKRRLMLKCENKYQGKRKRRGGEYSSSKADYKNHGFGIHNMRYVVSKYNGRMVIQDADEIFKVEILFYL